MKSIYYLLFYLTNCFTVPYRLTSIDFFIGRQGNGWLESCLVLLVKML
ncbi:hypothetical protein [Enterococcus hirae]|nr:hypothetical protein [Enterococcus hirae]